MCSKLNQIIANYIDAHNGSCEVYSAPFAVFLNEDDAKYPEPDLPVVCDKSKLNDDGIYEDLSIDFSQLNF